MNFLRGCAFRRNLIQNVSKALCPPLGICLVSVRSDLRAAETRSAEGLRTVGIAKPHAARQSHNALKYMRTARDPECRSLIFP